MRYFLQASCPSCTSPNQQCQSTEGKTNKNLGLKTQDETNEIKADPDLVAFGQNTDRIYSFVSGPHAWDGAIRPKPPMKTVHELEEAERETAKAGNAVVTTTIRLRFDSNSTALQLTTIRRPTLRP